MIINLIFLAVGVICAWAGSELFVNGSVALSRRFRIPPAIIGATIAAFATSSPELAVSITSALDQKPDISFGDIMGSNVVNIAFILGLALLISPFKLGANRFKRDFLFALLVPVLLGLTALDGVVSRSDAVILVSVFTFWLILSIWEAIRHRRDTAREAPATHSSGTWLSVLFLLLGTGLLIAAGKSIVIGASKMAQAWGWSNFIIGTTIVAVATGTPEIATTIVARIKGHHELGLGTLLGSNIFNGLFIIPVASLIYPISVAAKEALVGAAFGIFTTLIIWPLVGKSLRRIRGAFLFIAYAVFVLVNLRIASH
jgi:cation:H+ antiporter